MTIPQRGRAARFGKTRRLEARKLRSLLPPRAECADEFAESGGSVLPSPPGQGARALSRSADQPKFRRVRRWRFPLKRARRAPPEPGRPSAEPCGFPLERPLWPPLVRGVTVLEGPKIPLGRVRWEQRGTRVDSIVGGACPIRSASKAPLQVLARRPCAPGLPLRRACGAPRPDSRLDNRVGGFPLRRAFPPHPSHGSVEVRTFRARPIGQCSTPAESHIPLVSRPGTDRRVGHHVPATPPGAATAHSGRAETEARPRPVVDTDRVRSHAGTTPRMDHNGGIWRIASMIDRPTERATAGIRASRAAAVHRAATRPRSRARTIHELDGAADGRRNSETQPLMSGRETGSARVLRAVGRRQTLSPLDTSNVVDGKNARLSKANARIPGSGTADVIRCEPPLHAAPKADDARFLAPSTDVDCGSADSTRFSAGIRRWSGGKRAPFQAVSYNRRIPPANSPAPESTHAEFADGARLPRIPTFFHRMTQCPRMTN